MLSTEDSNTARSMVVALSHLDAASIHLDGSCVEARAEVEAALLIIEDVVCRTWNAYTLDRLAEDAEDDGLQGVAAAAERAAKTCRRS